MADFCVDCWNKLNDTNCPPSKFILSRNLELCEGCGEYKRVIDIELDDELKFFKRNFSTIVFWRIKRLFRRF
ncbi:MAG: hypothetical protein IKL05_03980 [Clostridia bacterium]|nr:hypothetical protein [Clostridia bacterium]